MASRAGAGGDIALSSASGYERIGETLEWARFPIPDAAWEELDAIGFSTDDPGATRAYVLG